MQKIIVCLFLFVFQLGGAAKSSKTTLNQQTIDYLLTTEKINSQLLIGMKPATIRSQCEALGYNKQDIEKLLRKRRNCYERQGYHKKRFAMVQEKRGMSMKDDITDSDIDIMKMQNPLSLEEHQVKRVLQILILQSDQSLKPNDFRQNALTDLTGMLSREVTQLAKQHNVSKAALMAIRQRAKRVYRWS